MGCSRPQVHAEGSAVVARSQRKSRMKKGGSRSSTARPSEIAEAEERPRGGERGLLARQGILVGSLLAAGLVLIGGLTFQRLTGDRGRQDLSDASPAVAFVGSETCAGCHRAQAALWHSSQHKARDGSRDREVGAGGLFRRHLRLLRSCGRASSVTTESFRSKRTAPTESSPLSRSSTRLASIHSSNI